MRILARGAEGIIYLENGILVKDRVCKKYRLSVIDNKLRRRRTKREVKLLKKLSFVPEVYNSNDFQIKMEFISGSLLKDVLDDLSVNKRREVLVLIGSQIAEMHDLNIIHGDLTTSNMILRGDEAVFIDFGLGFVSIKVEDKAVDLYLLKKALEAKHYQHFNESYGFVIEGYMKSAGAKAVLERLEKVEKRGRYKRKSEIG